MIIYNWVIVYNVMFTCTTTQYQALHLISSPPYRHIPCTHRLTFVRRRGNDACTSRRSYCASGTCRMIWRNWRRWKRSWWSCSGPPDAWNSTTVVFFFGGTPWVYVGYVYVGKEMRDFWTWSFSFSQCLCGIKLRRHQKIGNTTGMWNLNWGFPKSWGVPQ